MTEIIEYKEFLASCIKAPIEEVIRDYYECNKELRTDLEAVMIERDALLKREGSMTFEEQVKSQFTEEHYACINEEGYVDVQGFYFEKDSVKVDEYVHALCQKMWDGFDRFNEHILIAPED